MPACRPDVAVYLYEPGDGGLDRVAILLANGFAARGLKTELWLTRAQGACRGLIDAALHVRMIPAPATRRSVALVAQLPTLRRTIKAVKPRILLSAGNQSNLTVALACRGTATAPIAKLTNPVVRPGQTGVAARLRNARFQATARICAETLVLGTAEAQQLKAEWPETADHIHFTPLPIVTPAMIAAAAQPRDNAIPQLIAIGRLMPQKDHATLLAALALVTTPRWHLRIVGDGPLRAALVEQAKTLGIADHITFINFVDDPTPLLAQSELMILPSRWEGLGAVAIEALASGCRVVSTDCTPNLHDLLHAAGQTEPVPICAPAQLAQAIDHALLRPCNGAAMASATAIYHVDRAIDAHIDRFRPWLHPSA